MEPEADVENDGLIGMSMEFVDAPENEIVTSRDVTEAPDVKMMAMMASVGADFECAYRSVCAVTLDDIDRKAGRDEPLEDEKIDDDVTKGLVLPTVDEGRLEQVLKWQSSARAYKENEND